MLSLQAALTFQSFIIHSLWCDELELVEMSFYSQLSSIVFYLKHTNIHVNIYEVSCLRRNISTDKVTAQGMSPLTKPLHRECLHCLSHCKYENTITVVRDFFFNTKEPQNKHAIIVFRDIQCVYMYILINQYIIMHIRIYVCEQCTMHLFVL